MKKDKLTILLEELQSLLFITILIMLTFLMISLLTWTSPLNVTYNDAIGCAYTVTAATAIVRTVYRIKHKEG